MEREEVVSGIEITLIDNVYRQDHIGHNSEDRGLVGLLDRVGYMSHIMMSIRS